VGPVLGVPTQHRQLERLSIIEDATNTKKQKLQPQHTRLPHLLNR
jgi:hypothetical protein